MTKVLFRALLMCALTHSLLPVTAIAEQLTLNGELTQGTLLRGNVPENSKVWLNGKEIKVLPSGDFVIGFGRDAKLSHTLQWQAPEKSEKNAHQISLTQREYNIQRIEGVASKYVSPPQSVTDRIREDNRQIGAARRTFSNLTSFLETFILPAEGPISGVYGSQRVFNGEPKRPHYGLDIAGPVGTAIVAPASGRVSLAHDDMYYSGGTLIVDHGMGVSSTFIHLSKITVKEGEFVEQGQKIGEMGATGRVTGPHLDWRINWFSERLDPALVLPEASSQSD
ncbi:MULTISPECIES: M23 family metallopeptidase [Alteromonadaceae]|jgi:murein DD-endopeptidase MepM/ murein hydrolase activator NlpD|uniref:M23 family metallopeptidase n=1 Tax=Brumicola blandensis TaxID=3075611 RepID=A0AAW8R0B5_9ALTE|nr:MULTISPECIES: M23 family metallopeptidase [unclassified Alteromonas]MDT0581663.1 M23 family metallopeptidase [Alteromonas sp. W409]MDT0627238.1 M23 family metallopeptidase [Alteromonas sp. W364]